jgi:hypothetical protein
MGTRTHVHVNFSDDFEYFGHLGLLKRQAFSIENKFEGNQLWLGLGETNSISFQNNGLIYDIKFLGTRM